MKILQMISKNDRYGAQRIFLDQVAVLHRMGHEVTVVCRGAEGFVTDSVRAMGVPYYGIPMKGLKDIFFLRQFVKKNNIDVVHTTLDRADHVGLIVARLTGRPVVSTNMVPRAHIGFRFDDRVIVLANKQRPLLLDSGVKPEKIALIRPGIDVDRFAKPDAGRREAWKQKLKSDGYEIVFCHISSIIPRKAHDVSLDIAAECKKRGERPLLIIIGDPLAGEYYESLLAKIFALGLKENVYFTGWTAEVPEILTLSHFTVLPSENEALGVVLMEGMAAGTPIVAREGEGGAELIEEYGTGFLYRPSEGAGALAERLVALRRDTSRFAYLSARCRRIAAEQFSMQRFGERLIKVYEGLKAKGRDISP
jgi:glycosyltransferase involved in cell wall biosynthesis